MSDVTQINFTNPLPLVRFAALGIVTIKTIRGSIRKLEATKYKPESWIISIDGEHTDGSTYELDDQTEYTSEELANEALSQWVDELVARMMRHITEFTLKEKEK